MNCRSLALFSFAIFLSFCILKCNCSSSPKPEIDDRKRIKFGPIRSPFVSDLGAASDEGEEEEESEEDLNTRRSRTNVLYFLISSFANASNNLKTLVKFLLSSNQLILAGWIAFIIAIFVLSYLITINPVNQTLGANSESLLLKEELPEDEEEKSITKCNNSKDSNHIFESDPVKPRPKIPLESNRDRIQKALINIFGSRSFRNRLDKAFLECIQGNVHLLDEENETKIFHELSIDYSMPEQNMVVTGRAQDFKRTFFFENNIYWTVKDVKFIIESRNHEYAFKIPFEGNESIFENECKNLVQNYFVSLDVSEEMRTHFIFPYRQKSSLIRNNGDSLIVDVLKLTGAETDNLLHISLTLDEPSPQALVTSIAPFRTTNSDLIWNTQFVFAVSPYKSKKLSMEVIEEKKGGIIGFANIYTTDLHLIPKQTHTLPLLNPTNLSPSARFLSVQLYYNFSTTNLILNAQEKGLYVNKILDSTFIANQLTYKTCYSLGGSLESEEEKGSSASSLVANAALNNLLGVETGRDTSNLPYRSTMLITSVQKVPTPEENCNTQSYYRNDYKAPPTISPVPPEFQETSHLSPELKGFRDDKRSDINMNDEDLSNLTEISIESLPLSPTISQQVKTSSRNNFHSLSVPINPLKKSKDNFITSLKRILSGPSLYTLDVNSPRPRDRLYSSPSRLGQKKKKMSPCSISLKSLSKDLLSSRLNIRSNRTQQSGSDIGYSSNSDSEFSLELKSDWRGPRSLSWESFDSGASYLLLPGEGEGSSMSDVSGVSGTSFAPGSSNGNAVKKGGRSLLVFETNEYGLIRHYLIPHKKGGTRLSKRRGTKLHVFNNHLFIAKHIKRGTHCSVCKKRIILRIGKQGYVCRDCGKICHKHCHEKVEDLCLKSTFPTMELFRGSTIIKKKDR